MPGKLPNPPRSLVWWILFGVFWNCTGWVLSAFRLLNATGYGLAVLLGIAALLAFRRRLFLEMAPARSWRKVRRRFRRPIPMAFMILAGLGFAGGALYAPNNYDALAYRVPRVLHWLAEGRWHWIHTEFQRLNARGCGFEWVAAPFLVFTKSDRVLFLLNFASFCFLPGLLFSILRRLGVAGRTAWAWMWILPTGYCFLLQAGSLANDLFGATFVLASVFFALRAREGDNVTDLWLSLLAVGLFTAVKANNLPLLLVWAVIVAPCWKLALRRPAVLAAVGAVALCTSFVPTALFNFQNSHDWTGARAEQLQFKPPNLWARPLGNAGRIAIDSLLPPINPFARMWNEHVADKFVPASLKPALTETFRPEGPLLGASELETEEGAGLGMGICVLMVFSWLAAIVIGGTTRWKLLGRITPRNAMVLLASLIAFAAFLQASFVASTPRLAMAYYPFLTLPLLLHPAQTRVVRSRWWRIGALAACVLAMLVMIVSPARPLFPVKYVLDTLHRLSGQQSLVSRAEKVYSVYGDRANAFASAIALLPPETKVIGMVTFDDPEAPLWRPLGSRRVLHVCADDSSAHLQAEGVREILVNPAAYPRVSPLPFDEWLRQMNAEVVATVPLNLRAGNKPVAWQLVRLR